MAENVAQLAVHLGAHGWEAEVAGPPEATIYPRLAAGGVPVHRLPLCRDYGDVRREATALRRLLRLLRSGPYDLVHCHSAKVGVLGRLAAGTTGVPIVYSPHALPFVGPFGLGRRVGARAVERALAPLTARILCVSEDERREANAAGLGGRGRLRVVHNGCAGCDDSISSDPRLAALREAGPVAGAVAVLRPQKRLDLLVDAAPEVLRRVPAARVAIIGNGPLAAPLRERAERRGLAREPRFHFLPFAPPVERYLSALDVFVLPSDWEGLSIAVLEALACGVPQVATDVGGTGEAVTGDTGVLVPPGDAGALAEALVGLLQDEEQRQRMAEASVRRHRASFTLERMVAMTAAVYEEALDGHGLSRRVAIPYLGGR
ncbi:MAG TPA: glycosyltransferase [Solirubrobacteraceae bacterium]|nr:glycosyltransferase [Solirubrobacteraceae bacterium]